MQFRAQIAEQCQWHTSVFSPGMLKLEEYKDIPNGHFAHQIIIVFELFHLPVPHCTILSIGKVMFDFMPLAAVLQVQSHLHSEASESAPLHI